MRSPSFFIAIACALALAAPAGHAQDAFEPVENIRQAALAAVPGAEAGQAEATLDPALRLPRCAAGLQATLASAGTIEVGCPGGWRLFVPVRVQRVQPVLVLVANAAAGEPLRADQLRVETRDAGRVLGAPLTDPSQAIGRTLRRPTRAGQVIAAADLQAERLVRRGDPVTLVSGAGGIEVRMAGRAMGPAGIAEAVAVENLSSRRVVHGVVMANGEVRVGGR
jgi:flagella basal body P-ring formation protein FlgA